MVSVKTTEFRNPKCNAIRRRTHPRPQTTVTGAEDLDNVLQDDEVGCYQGRWNSDGSGCSGIQGMRYEKGSLENQTY